MKNNASNFGTGFALLTLFGMAVLFYFYVTDYFDKQHQVRQHIEIKEHQSILTIYQSNDGHYRINGLINNHPVIFLVDTGASSISLSESLANKVGLRKERRGQSHTANGITEGWSTNIKQIKIDGLTINDMGAWIVPNMHDEVLLGMNFLRHFHWQQQQGELILTLSQ